MSKPPLEFDHVHLIAEEPKKTVEWYVEMLGAEVMADTVARGAPQIFLEIGGKIVIVRGKRPGENPTAAKPFGYGQMLLNWDGGAQRNPEI